LRAFLKIGESITKERKHMKNTLKKTYLLLPAILACLICPTISGQEKQSRCVDHPSLWRDAQGKPYRLKGRELEERRIYCEPPKLPGDQTYHGAMVFQVMINAEGKIECVDVIRDFLVAEVKKSALDALKKWTFKPVKVDGKPIAVLGFAIVDVSWDSAPGQCRSK
jgi:Gram-negative bacterial TonB protein C-terminal